MQTTLPIGTVIEQYKQSGYAASANCITALQKAPIAKPRSGAETALRGDLVPLLMGAADGLQAAAQIARSKAEISGEPEYGHLFRIEIDARIAIPSAQTAVKMATNQGIGIWDALRPFAEERAFDGVKFPFGLVIFEAAQDGICIREDFVWKIKSNGLPLDR
ncbi:MAG TPA: hypothetical protein VFM94_06760 [Solirubrobacterales bacterium]|nr:hypothetical protein [Solirubrobacterales bacterium]